MTYRGPIPPALDDLDLPSNEDLRHLLIYAEQAG